MDRCAMYRTGILVSTLLLAGCQSLIGLKSLPTRMGLGPKRDSRVRTETTADRVGRETADARMLREAERRQQILDQQLTDATPEERLRWSRMAQKLDPRELELALANRMPVQSAIVQPTYGWGHGTDGLSGPLSLAGHADERTPDSRVIADQDRIVDLLPPGTGRQPMSGSSEELPVVSARTERQTPSSPPPLANRQESPTESPFESTIAETREEDWLTGLDNPDPGLSAAGWNQELRKLINLAESDLAESDSGQMNHDEYVRKHVHLRLLYLVSGQAGRAVSVIPDIDSSEQEYWQQQLFALNKYFAAERIPSHEDRVTESLSDLRMAIQHMRTQARLQIRNMNFCSRIASYGVYDRMLNSRFQVGQQVLVYAEIENFRSEEVMDTGIGKFKTKLSSTLEVYADQQGGLNPGINQHPIRIERFSPTVDLCSSPRRDYFNAYTYQLPADLLPGRYRLVLTVRDELGEGFASESLNFEILP